MYRRNTRPKWEKNGEAQRQRVLYELCGGKWVVFRTRMNFHRLRDWNSNNQVVNICWRFSVSVSLYVCVCDRLLSVNRAAQICASNGDQQQQTTSKRRTLFGPFSVGFLISSFSSVVFCPGIFRFRFAFLHSDAFRRFTARHPPHKRADYSIFKWITHTHSRVHTIYW